MNRHWTLASLCYICFSAKVGLPQQPFDTSTQTKRQPDNKRHLLNWVISCTDLFRRLYSQCQVVVMSLYLCYHLTQTNTLRDIHLKRQTDNKQQLFTESSQWMSIEGYYFHGLILFTSLAIPSYGTNTQSKRQMNRGHVYTPTSPLEDVSSRTLSGILYLNYRLADENSKGQTDNWSKIQTDP